MAYKFYNGYHLPTNSFSVFAILKFSWQLIGNSEKLDSTLFIYRQSKFFTTQGEKDEIYLTRIEIDAKEPPK